MQRVAKQLQEDSAVIVMRLGGFPWSRLGGDGGSDGIRTQIGGAIGKYDIAESFSLEPLGDLVTFRAIN